MAGLSRAVRVLASAAVLSSTAVVVAPGAASAVVDDAAPVFINELHYDNDGADAGEFVEVAGPAGTDLTGWSIEFVNGSNGAVYSTVALSGTIPDQDDGFGTLAFDEGGIQNGAPDGVALVDDTGSLVEFLSYEGAFAATSGAANGQTSTDIGVSESSSTPVGESLQKTGTGSTAGDFTWQTPATGSPGAVNAGQDFGGGTSASTVFISEIHYDNDGADTGEFVEVEGDAGTDLTGWSLVPYNGNGGTQYSVTPLTGTIDDESAGQGAVSFPIAGLQNGAPDGVALVDDTGTVIEFLSYEGDFTATDGPANGLGSTDIGVSEPGDTPIGESLQLVDGTWTGPAPASPGDLNTAGPQAGLPLPFVESFDTDCVADGFQIVSVDTDAANTWTCSTSFSNADVNGFGDAAPADEWLITPALDLDAQTDEILEFRNYTAFTDVAYPQLEVVWSTDYDGTDPTTATWTALTGIDFSPEDSGQWVDSGAIDLSGIAGDAVYFAFHYTSSGTASGEAATWRIDQVEFTVDDGGTGGPQPYFIHEIQGAGDASPLDGSQVVISGIVVGDFQEIVTADPGDEPLEGFFVQEEDADADADASTSEGIFVYFPANTVAVAVGDLVEVTGTVDEFFDLTEIVNVTDVTVVSSGNPLPTPATPVVPTSLADDPVDWEAIEGMSVSFDQPLYVSDLFPLGSYGEVGLSAIGPWNHPNQVAPQGSAAADDVRALNAISKVLLDDGEDENESFPSGISTWNPTPTPYIDGPEGTLRAGDVVNDLAGVVHYAFGEFEVQPVNVSDPTDPDGAVDITYVPRPSAVPDVGGDLTVASFNVLNYFVTIDTGGATCGPPGNEQGCRGADTQAEFDLQSSKIADAIADLDADIVGLIELENSGNDEAIADLVAKVNARSARTYDYVPTGFIGTDAIAVGFIYDAATVARDGDYAVLDSSVSQAFIDDKNRPALAQTFTDLASGQNLTVSVNHLKSKGSDCGDVANPGDPNYGVDPYPLGADGDVGDDPEYTGNCSLTRTAAAKVLGQWMTENPTGVPSDNLLILGDLNAYAHEDPITELEGQGYADLKEQFTASNAWADGGHSYVFDGEFGTLDYGLGNPALLEQVTGAAAWHINADEPFAIDYQNFNPPGQAQPDQWKSSDHDPLLIGISLAPPEPVLTCATVSGTRSELEAAGYTVIIGTNRRDDLVGTDGNDFILGGNGNDWIEGRDGDDVICGGNGRDWIRAGDGDDIADGGTGLDSVNGGDGDDVLEGGNGNDAVRGGRGDDIVSGGNGNDWLQGDRGTDVCDGGKGRRDGAARSCETKLNIP